MNNSVRNTQNRLLLSLAAVTAIGLSALSYYLVRDDVFPPAQIKATVLPLDKSNPQDLRMTRLESEKAIADQKVYFLENAALDNLKREEQREQESQVLKEEIFKLKEGLRAVVQAAAAPPIRESNPHDSLIQPTQLISPPSSQSAPIRGAFSGFDTDKPRPSENMHSYDPFAPPIQPRSDLAPHQIPPRTAFSELVIDKPCASEKMHHVDQVIPSGTSVKAILVSSVDMPCGVSGSTDPQPVKLRLIDDGRLPKRVRVRLKGSIIIGSAYGDLSNERIYMRIERLTQVRHDGTFIETEVAGYVTGEDGKYGVKGCVVDKSYKMVENAAISGLFNGVSQYLQATATRGCCGIYEPGCCPINAYDLASTSATGCANGAFDVLTNYYIKRAEQIRPVIKASAGRVVDVTFIHNAEMGDLHVQDKIRQIRETNRRAT